MDDSSGLGPRENFPVTAQDNSLLKQSVECRTENIAGRKQKWTDEIRSQQERELALKYAKDDSDHIFELGLPSPWEGNYLPQNPIKTTSDLIVFLADGRNFAAAVASQLQGQTDVRGLSDLESRCRQILKNGFRCLRKLGIVDRPNFIPSDDRPAELLIDKLIAWLRKRMTQDPGDPDSRAISFQLFPQGPLENQDVTDLVMRLHAESGSGKSMIQIAREYLANRPHVESKANSLLSRIRRLKAESRVRLDGKD